MILWLKRKRTSKYSKALSVVEVIIYCLAVLVEIFRCTRSLFALLFRQCVVCIASGRLRICCHTADSLGMPRMFLKAHSWLWQLRMQS